MKIIGNAMIYEKGEYYRLNQRRNDMAKDIKLIIYNMAHGKTKDINKKIKSFRKKWLEGLKYLEK